MLLTIACIKGATMFQETQPRKEDKNYIGCKTNITYYRVFDTKHTHQYLYRHCEIGDSFEKVHISQLE